MNRKILIAIDLLNDFLHKDGALYCGDAATAIIAPVQNKIRDMAKHKGNVIFLCDAHTSDDKEFAMFAPHAVKGQWGAQLLDEIMEVVQETGVSHTIVEKTRYSGFYNTTLESTLRQLGVFSEQKPEPIVEIAGVCTSICVMDTVGDLSNRDVQAYVSKSCVADFDPEAHTAAIKRMSSLYGAHIID